MNIGDTLIIPANPECGIPEKYQIVKSFDDNIVIFDITTTFETYNPDGTIATSETRHGEATMPRIEADTLAVK